MTYLKNLRQQEKSWQSKRRDSLHDFAVNLNQKDSDIEFKSASVYHKR